MLRLVEREMKRDSWSLFLFFVAMTKHNEGGEREREKSDRFVCIDNASMCIQSSDQVSSFEIRVVKFFSDLYKQTIERQREREREENTFTNPDTFLYICFRKKEDKKEKKKKKIHESFEFRNHCILPGKSACGRWIFSLDMPAK